MSVIAAKVFPDYIEIASDSILIKDDLKKTNFKKIHTNQLITAGGCGSAEELCLFFTFIEEHEPRVATVSGILSYMKQFAKWKFDYVNDDTINNCYIIIYKGKLFEVDGMFVQEIKEHTAIGEGEAYALAALHLKHSIEEAVKTACDLSCYVSEPIVKYKINKK